MDYFLVRDGDSLLPFSQNVERLIDERERIDIAAVGLAGTKVFVLELEFRIRNESGLRSDPLDIRYPLRFRFYLCPRTERLVDSFLKAEPLLRPARTPDQYYQCDYRFSSHNAPSPLVKHG